MTCPECRQPFPESKMCEECGIFYDEQEYIVHDLYNYQARPQRLYNRLDHFKKVLGQWRVEVRGYRYLACSTSRKTLARCFDHRHQTGDRLVIADQYHFLLVRLDVIHHCAEVPGYLGDGECLHGKWVSDWI